MLEKAKLLLKKNILFADLDDQALQNIADQCNWMQLGIDQQIVGQADSTTDVFFIAKGSIRVKIFSSAGKEVSYLDMHDGQFFGEFSAIDGETRSASVLTLSDTLIGKMSAVDFNAILLEHPLVTQKLLKHLVGKARQLTDRVFEFSTLAVRNRLHCELLRLAGEANGINSVTIKHAPTHYELATRISTHREAVTRELKYLTTEDLIELRRGEIKILDIRRLRNLVERIDDH